MIRIYSAFALALLVANAVHGQSQPNIYTATLGEGGARTAEISTEELRHILTEKSATVFDVRPASEFAISHIPGALNVAQKPGTSKALYGSDAAEINRFGALWWGYANRASFKLQDYDPSSGR